MSDTTSFQREHGPVTSELLVRLATLLNDYNPAHYDLDFAHEIGMPGVIGPGTLLQGWILSDIGLGSSNRGYARSTSASARHSSWATP